MELNLLWPHSNSFGYGRYGTQLAAALERLGVTIYDDIPAPPEQGTRRRAETDGKRPGVAKLACWVSTPSHARGWWKGQIPIISTMWEATSLPAAFTENLHEFATCIVPSQQNVDLFSRFHPNVRYLPLGIDPDVWYYTPRREPGAYFDFLIGGSGPRKGTMLAYDAFLRVFGSKAWEKPGRPIPRLTLKSPKGEEKIDHPRVSMVKGRLTDEEEVALYLTAHCYLQPSRGEGFGLQPLQAIAQGIPTILTAAHGHGAFAHLGIGLDSKLTKAGVFMFGDAGEWWEPDFDQLCEAMRDVYDNYTRHAVHAHVAADEVAREFTWDRCAERFLDIVGLDLLRPLTPVEWYSPVHTLYKVVTIKDHTADVGGTMRHYYQGTEYWEPADVKRILFEARLLDPVCLDGDDIGLHPDQLGMVESYSASREYCPHCHQRMGTNPTKADDLWAAEIATVNPVRATVTV